MNRLSLFATFLGLALGGVLPAQRASLSVKASMPNRWAAVLQGCVEGPPGGMAVILAAPGVLTRPIQTPFGGLYLPPHSLTVLGAIPLDGKGQGTFTAVLPVQPRFIFTAGMQALSIDATFSKFSLTDAVAVAADLTALLPDGALTYNKTTGDWGLGIIVAPGDTVVVRILPAGGGAPVVVGGPVVAGPTGYVELNGTNVLGAGDQLQATVNGVPFLTITN